MAFANHTTLFYLPIGASKGSNLWGTAVYKLLGTADATADSTTTMNHGTGTGQAVRTVEPYVTANATDADDSLFGWGFLPSDLNSVTGGLRVFRTGNHVATMRLNYSNTLGDSGASMKFSVYRVSSAATSRVRTLIAQQTTAITFPAAGSEATYTATITSAPEIVLGVDESLHYSFEISAAGLIVTGATTTFVTGTSGGVAVQISTPDLVTIADTVATVAASAVVVIVTGKVLGTNVAVTGSVAVVGKGNAIAASMFAVAETSPVVGVGGAVIGGVATIAASVVVAPKASIVLGTVFVTGTGGPGGGGGTTIVKRFVPINEE